MEPKKKVLLICTCFLIILLNGCEYEEKLGNICKVSEVNKNIISLKITDESQYLGEAVKISVQIGGEGLSVLKTMNPELGELTESLIEDEDIRKGKEYIEKVFLEALTIPGQAEKYFNEEIINQFIEMKGRKEYTDNYYNRARCFLIRHDGVEKGMDEAYIGYVIVDNDVDSWEKHGKKKEVFIDFVYFPDDLNCKWYVDEVVETDTGIVDYDMGYIDIPESTIYEIGIAQEKIVRLLDKDVELNKAFQIKKELKDEKIEQYIEMIFLDICRYPENISKYNKVLDSEFIGMFQKIQWFYKQPEKVYDLAHGYLEEVADNEHGINLTRGSTYITSQFEPGTWDDQSLLVPCGY